MWREIQPDETRELGVKGGKVVTCSFGSDDGPGLPRNDLRDSDSCLMDFLTRRGGRG
ncbi:MAG: hypothetical protein H7Y08_08180 [Rhizobiaceae bacterium]|nr:hypothetical protein [Rhizobiaceae bacterium]